MNHFSPAPQPTGPSRASSAPIRALEALLPAINARAASLDADGGLPVDDVSALATAGLLVAPLPRSLGGLGWGSEPDGMLPLMRALRLLGRASLPLGRLFEGHVTALYLLNRHGTPAQRRSAATDARGGALFGVWYADDAAGLRLDPAPGGFVLQGRKRFCSGAGLVERALVTAREGNAQPRMVLVSLPRGTERADLSRWTPLGMRASVTGEVDLSGLAAPRGALIGAPGDHLCQPGFSGGAWRFLAVQLGGIEAVVELTRTHLEQAGRGGDPHQAARFGNMATLAETARLWVREAAALAEEDMIFPERVVAYADLARGAVERAALDVLELAHRSVGLVAMLRPSPLERVARDLATYLRQPMPDRALNDAASAALRFAEPVGDQWSAGCRAGTA